MKSIIVVMTVITIIAITGEATNTKPFNELLEGKYPNEFYHFVV